MSDDIYKKLSDSLEALKKETPDETTTRQITELEGKFTSLENKIETGLSTLSEELKKKLESELVLEIDKEELKGKDGTDYALTNEDKKEIASFIEVPIVEITTKEIPIVTEIIKEVAVPETAEEIRNKLELLVDDNRLDKKAIRGLDIFIDQTTLDRAIGILDQRTSFLINRVNNLPQTGGGTTVLFGSDNQIPFVNATGTNFEYSASLLYNGTELDIFNNGIGTAVTDALMLGNSTAAAAGAQQASGTIHWQGNGWKTNSIAASQSVDFQQYLLSVQGAANPTGLLRLQASVNGAAYASVLDIDSRGFLITPTIQIWRNGGTGTYSQFYNNTSRTGMTTGMQFLTDNGAGAAGGALSFISGSQGMEIDANAGVTTRFTFVYGGNRAFFELGSAFELYGGTGIPLRLGAGATKTYLQINTSGLIQFHGTTSSFPALKRSSAVLQARLADDSAYAQFDALGYSVGGTQGATGTFTTADLKTVTVTNGIIVSII